MKIVGIDPGMTGALAVLDGGEVVAVEDLPVVHVRNTAGKLRGEYIQYKLVEYLERWRGHVFLEKQQAFPGTGARCPVCKQARGQGVVSTGTTMEGFGMLKGMLAALRIPYELVPSVTWKRAMLEGLGRDKSHSLSKARALFPTVDLGRRKDAGRAESLLIAEYGRRMLNGGLTKAAAQV